MIHHQDARLRVEGRDLPVRKVKDNPIDKGDLAQVDRGRSNVGQLDELEEVAARKPCAGLFRSGGGRLVHDLGDRQIGGRRLQGRPQAPVQILGPRLHGPVGHDRGFVPVGGLRNQFHQPVARLPGEQVPGNFHLMVHVQGGIAALETELHLATSHFAPEQTGTGGGIFVARSDGVLQEGRQAIAIEIGGGVSRKQERFGAARAPAKRRTGPPAGRIAVIRLRGRVSQD